MTNKEILDYGFDKNLFSDVPRYTLSDINVIQDLTRADERQRVIREIEKMLEPKLVTLYQSELAIENYKSEFRAKLNSLKP